MIFPARGLGLTVTDRPSVVRVPHLTAPPQAFKIQNFKHIYVTEKKVIWGANPLMNIAADCPTIDAPLPLIERPSQTARLRLHCWHTQSLSMHHYFAAIHSYQCHPRSPIATSIIRYIQQSCIETGVKRKEVRCHAVVQGAVVVTGQNGLIFVAVAISSARRRNTAAGSNTPCSPYYMEPSVLRAISLQHLTPASVISWWFCLSSACFIFNAMPFVFVSRRSQSGAWLCIRWCLCVSVSVSVCDQFCEQDISKLILFEIYSRQSLHTGLETFGADHIQDGWLSSHFSVHNYNTLMHSAAATSHPASDKHLSQCSSSLLTYYVWVLERPFGSWLQNEC